MTIIDPGVSLADLAVTRPGASRVFHRHGLDFCCHGNVSLASACETSGLDADALIDELQKEEALAPDFDRWDRAPLGELIEHLLERYHEPHRRELPRLVEMAGKVERVHAEKASCPRGLREHLERMHAALELHMEKEEQVLFPMIRAGRGVMASMPVQVMREEHDEHGANLARMRELAHDYEAPEEACGTWKALYLGLAELESEVMHHVHLENNVLFPHALAGSPS